MTTTQLDLTELRAEELMTTDLQWAQPTDELRAAGDHMVRQGVRALLVPGRTAADLPGILTSKDIVNLVAAHDTAILDQLAVADAATHPAICVPATANVLDCVNLMRMSGVRRVPVLRGTEVVGILSLSDILPRMLAR